MNHFILRRFISFLCLSGAIGFSTEAMASAFQLWEQDVASIGNDHAGYAAEANDASTSFYNPAGIPRIKNQQAVFGGVGIMSDFKYTGTIGVNSIFAGAPRAVTAQGGNFGFVPSLHYVAPISDTIGFGLSVTAPFGLKTTYGRSTILQYAATTTGLTVVDISPALGIQLTDKASIGFGLDIQRMYAEFDQVGGLGFPTINGEGINKASDTGYGSHFGALYQFSEKTRVGISYHTQVVHHLNGTSRFIGDLPVTLFGHELSSHAYANIRMPGYTALSVFHKVQPKVALMASVIYTEWNYLKTLQLNGVSGIQGILPSSNITVIVPEHYRNTWNVSVGANYYPSDQYTLRCGMGFDQTPTRDAYRNVALPDNNRVVLAVGGHYQATKTIGFDMSWSHFIMKQVHINPPPQQTGLQVVTTNGSVRGGADVLGASMTWDMF